MFLLDMKTIFVLLVVGHIFTVILISAYWRNHKNDNTLNIFFYGKCVQAVAWGLLTARGGIPDVFTISLANSMLFIGAYLETTAFLKLRNFYSKKVKEIYMLFLTISVMGFHYIILFHNEESLRVAFASFATVLFLFLPVYHLIFEKKSSLLAKIMGYLFLIVIVGLSVRGVAALLSNQTMGLFTPSVTQTFSFIALYLVMILGNTGFILLLKEKTDAELVRLANYDDLTNIYNRRTFINAAKKYLDEAMISQRPVSLLLFDVDHFKQINDQYGHDTGDRVLRDMADKIKEHLKHEQLFGRYGGDEFTIFLPGMDEEESSKFAEAIKAMMEGNSNIDLPIHYTLSIGMITVIPDENTKLETLYLLCDQALYGAKKEGRNCFRRARLSNMECIN